MQDLPALLTTARHLLATGEPSLFATLIATEGSSYRSAGSILIAAHTGPRAGAISGGCLEDYVIREGLALTRESRTTVMEFETTHDPDEVRPSPGCGGKLFVLVEPLTPAHLDLLTQIAHARTQNQTLRLTRQVHHTPGLTTTHTTLTPVTPSTSPATPTQSRTPGFFSVTTEIRPPLRLILLGAGDDVIPLVHQAKLLDWHVTVADRRLRLATPERFPHADRVLASPWSTLIPRLTTDARTAIVLITHSLPDDAELLPLLVNHPAFFLGMLGPPARRSAVLREAQARGTPLPESFLARLHSPVGLDLGEKSPAAIALSICAQIIAVTTGKIGSVK